MKLIVIFIASFMVAVKAASVSKLFTEKWRMFKMQHRKTYEHEHEEEYRMRVYLDNLHLIEEHNKHYAAGNVSFELGMNQFGDLTLHEFKRMMLMKSVTRNTHYESMSKSCQQQSPYHSSMALAERWNWVETGAVTPVRDQKSCASCWAFSAVGALEGHHYMKTKKLVNLSEQNLMDCSSKYGNGGCTGGGWPQDAFLYVIDNGGIDTRESYPFKGKDGDECLYDPRNSGEAITGCRILPANDEEQLRIAVEKEGPISVAMAADTFAFRFYKSGIFYSNECDHKYVDHAVLLVGFGSENGHDYWLGKNSWNTAWGEKGYFRIARNVGNHCGIASASVFPVTDKYN